MTARRTIIRACMVLWALCAFTSTPTEGVEIIYPVADGTLADGGDLGDYNGVVDGWDWTFKRTGFSGAVTLSTETPDGAVEQRIVAEYDLRGVNVATPIEATLTFTARGIRAFPFPDATLHVYSYPADLLESPEDYSRGPAILRGTFTVSAAQPATLHALDVTDFVASVLSTSDKRLAFRFQINPNTPHQANQVFIDALDSEPSTKPTLIIRSAVPGDADDDGDADLDDFTILLDCLAGPFAPSTPTTQGVTETDCLRVFDHDGDDDIDLKDLSNTLHLFTR